MSEEHTEKVPFSSILQAALATRQPGEDLDEALLRALKADHPEHAAMLLAGMIKVIDREGERTHEDREQVVRRLAASDSGAQTTLQATDIGPLNLKVESTVYRIGGKEYHSLDELPPTVRRAVEAALPFARTAAPAPTPSPSPSPRGADDRRAVRLGCSTALLALLLRLLSR